MTYPLYWAHVPLAPALAAVAIYRGFDALVDREIGRSGLTASVFMLAFTETGYSISIS